MSKTTVASGAYFPDPRRIAARCASAYSRLCTGMEHEVQQVGVVGIAEERLGMSPEKINIKMPEYGQLIVPADRRLIAVIDGSVSAACRSAARSAGVDRVLVLGG